MRLEFVTDQRGYCVEMERDLFGDVVLRRRWYSLRTRRHGGKQQVFSEEVAAIKVIEAIPLHTSFFSFKNNVLGENSVRVGGCQTASAPAKSA